MKRKFVTNLAFLLFLNLLIKPFYVLGIDVSIQNSVTAASYGIYFPLLNLALMFQVLLDMGVENFTRREIARNHNVLSKYLSNTILMKLLLSVIYFIFCIFIGVLSNYSWFQIKLLTILLFNQFLASFILYLRANIGGLHLFKTESIISVLDKTFLILICGVLIWGGITDVPFKIEWFIYAQTFSYGATLLISFIILFKRDIVFRFHFNFSSYIAIIKKSLPYAILTLLMSSYYRIDSILLERLANDGDVQAGIYAHSFRLLDMLQNYGYLFSLILLPMFSKMIKNKEPVEQLVNVSSSLIMVPSLIVIVGSVFYRIEIIDLLYNEHIQLSSKVFSILMPAFFSICTSYIFGTLLTANGNLKILILISALGVFVSLAMNLVLIPKIGVLGSAIANLSAQSLTAILSAVFATKLFRLKINGIFILKLSIYLIIIIAIAYYCTTLKYNWKISIGIYLTSAVIMTFIVRLMKLKNFYELLKPINK